MSLFDGQADRIPERKPHKVKALKKTKKEVSQPRKLSVTERYKKGILKFPDVSAEFLLCHCNQAPEYHSAPHAPHSGDLNLFNYHRRLRWSQKRRRYVISAHTKTD